MNLVLSSKDKKKWQKMAKAKEVQKNTNRRRSEAKG